MTMKTVFLASLAALLGACSTEPMPPPPLINSGSYDWTDQVRDAQGYPLQGWGNIIGPNMGSEGDSP